MGSRRSLRVLTGLALFGAVAAATVFSPAFSASGAKQRTAPRLEPGIELEASEGPAGPLGEEPAARAEWFQRQRAYPAAEIPPRALKRAARQAHRLELSTRNAGSSEAAAAQPSLDWTSIGPRPINDEQGRPLGRPAASQRSRRSEMGRSPTSAPRREASGRRRTRVTTGRRSSTTRSAPAEPGSRSARWPSIRPTRTRSTPERARRTSALDSYFGGGIFKSTNAGGDVGEAGRCALRHLLRRRSRDPGRHRPRVGRSSRALDSLLRRRRLPLDRRRRQRGRERSPTTPTPGSPPIWPNGEPPIRTTGAFDVAPGVAGTWFATVHGDDPAHAGGNIFRSTDDGASWTPARGRPADDGKRPHGDRDRPDRPESRLCRHLQHARRPNTATFSASTCRPTAGRPGRSSRRRSPRNLCGYGGSGRGACNQRLSIAVDPLGCRHGRMSAPSTGVQVDGLRTNVDVHQLRAQRLQRLRVRHDRARLGSATTAASFRRSTDGSVENLNSTLPITQFEWGIAGEADADGPIFGGTQDTTTVRRRPDGSWRVYVL